MVHRAHALASTQGLQATENALCWHIATDWQAFEDARRDGAIAQALAWRCGPPLEGLDDPDNAALTEALAAALADVQGQVTPAACAAAARRLLAVDPLDEPAMQTLLQAELRQGHAAEARAEYRRYAARLAQELGVEPARVLRELVQGAGLGATAGLAVETSPAAAAPAAAGDDGFIGRRLELAEAQALLARPEARCLTLLGPGGIGKSRLAQQLSLRCAAFFPGGAAREAGAGGAVGVQGRLHACRGAGRGRLFAAALVAPGRQEPGGGG